LLGFATPWAALLVCDSLGLLLVCDSLWLLTTYSRQGSPTRRRLKSIAAGYLVDTLQERTVSIIRSSLPTIVVMEVEFPSQAAYL